MRLHYTSLLLSVLLTGLWPAQLSAQTFIPLTVEEGLSSNQIRVIFQDSRGYLWVGTSWGLNRYDGYEVTVYRHTEDDPTSLSHNNVWAIEETSDGVLWIGTAGGGLNRMDAATGRFTRFQHDPDDPMSLSHGGIFAIAQTSDGVLWIGTNGGGLNRMDAATGRFTRFQHDPDDPTSLSSDEVFAIEETSDGVLWIGTVGGGLSRFEPSTGRFTRFQHDSDDPTSLSDDYVRVMEKTSDGALWIGTRNGGLNRMDAATGRFTRFRHNPDDPTSLSSDVVWALHESDDGTLWIGNRWRGLDRLIPSTSSGQALGDTSGATVLSNSEGPNAATGRFAHFRNQEGDPTSLSSDDINAIAQTSDGVLWIGTNDGGLNRMDAATRRFTRFRHNPDDPASLGSGGVQAIEETSEGVLWIGTWGGGLNRMDETTGRFTRFRHNPDDPTSLSDDAVWAMEEASDGVFWIGTRSGGLNRMDVATGRFTRFQHDPDDPTSLGGGGVRAIAETSEGVLWIGSGWGGGLPRSGGGLSRLDVATGRFTRFQHDPGDSTSLSHNYITAIAQTSDGVLWIGTANGGLNRFEPSTGRFTRFQHDPDDPTSLSDDAVWAMEEASDGVFWIGTSGGLTRMVRNTEPPSFTSYIAGKGAADASPVQSITADQNGLLWLGLYNGRLARFNPETEHFRFFGHAQGLPIVSFSRSSIQRRTGTMYLGHSNGVIAFDPDLMAESPVAPQLHFTELKLFNRVLVAGEDAALPVPLSEAEQVVFNHLQNDLTFGFVGLHYAAPEANRYNYRLRPYDQDWRGETGDRRATYTNLQPGSYTFAVKASNSDGVWTEEEMTLEVTILPPWWQTWWAYSLYGIFIVSGLFAADRIQRRRLIREEREKARERELEQAREIEKAHTELQETHTQLAESHQHLKTTQQQLIQQEKMASLGQLTAGIAHEIKNPLNFVNNFAEVNEELAQELREAIANGEDIEDLLADLEQNAHVIAKHGKRADGIVKSMMEHARGGEGQRQPTDVNTFVEEYFNLAYHGMRAKVPDFNATLDRDYDEEVGSVEMVPQDIGRVLINLLNNAFYAVHEKAQAINGDFEPTVTVSTHQQADHVEIRVTDNGSGIPAEIQEKIFEPFYTTKPTGKGNTGLGLSLAYDIVTQGHGGTLTVESTEGTGTTFIITI